MPISLSIHQKASSPPPTTTSTCVFFFLSVPNTEIHTSSRVNDGKRERERVTLCFACGPLERDTTITTRRWPFQCHQCQAFSQCPNRMWDCANDCLVCPHCSRLSPVCVCVCVVFVFQTILSPPFLVLEGERESNATIRRTSHSRRCFWCIRESVATSPMVGATAVRVVVQITRWVPPNSGQPHPPQYKPNTPLWSNRTLRQNTAFPPR